MNTWHRIVHENSITIGDYSLMLFAIGLVTKFVGPMLGAADIGAWGDTIALQIAPILAAVGVMGEMLAAQIKLRRAVEDHIKGDGQGTPRTEP